MSDIYQEPAQGEKRQGETGVWTFVTITGEGKVLATSEWGTNYEFARKEWNDLPKVRPIIQLARVLECELQRSKALTERCKCGSRMLIMCWWHLAMFIALGAMIGAFLVEWSLGWQ